MPDPITHEQQKKNQRQNIGCIAAILVASFIIYFFTSNHNRSEPTAEELAIQQATETQKALEKDSATRSYINEKLSKNSAFLSHNLKIDATLETLHEHSLTKKCFLITQYNHNADTLKKCTEIILDSIYDLIPKEVSGKILSRCGVYLFTSKQNYLLGAKWISMGIRNMGEEPRVLVNTY